MPKELYKFNIYKTAEIEEEKQETVKNEAGEESVRTYKEKVTKKVPVEVIVNLPSRKQMQEADLEYSIEMSKCIRAGVLTKAMLLNKYSDTGGLISDSDAKVMLDSTNEIREIQAKLLSLNIKPESERTEEEKKKIDEYSGDILKLRRQLTDKETSYYNLFNHTADSKALNKVLLWYTLYLTFFKDSSVKNPEIKPLFEGKTFDAKEQAMFDLEESNNEVFEKCFTKVTSLVSYWYLTNGSTEKEEFDKIIGEIDAPAT